MMVVQTALPLTGPAPLNVTFTDTTTGAPISWLWDFGDSETSTERNPSHIYAEAGTFNVNLAAANAAGSNATVKAGYINVTEISPTLIVDVIDFNTLELIPFATVSLRDFAPHNQWQNITTPNGTVIFTSSGSSQQYPLVIGTQYGIWASADGYSEIRNDTTLSSNEQKVEIKLKKNEPTPTDYTYSITFAELAGTDRNLTIFQPAIPMIMDALDNTAGWHLNLYHNDSNISKIDFGTNGEGGLRDSTLHWHIGHGYGNGGLELPNNQAVQPDELEKKWGGNNKWVFLHSCEALENEGDWGNTLETTHGIFGFKTSVEANPNLGPAFFEYAMDGRRSLLDAYSNATMDLFDTDVTARVIFDTEDQIYGDHLPVYGTIESDESPDDNYYFELNWTC